MNPAYTSESTRVDSPVGLTIGKWAIGLGAFLLIVLSAGFAVYRIQPMAALSADAPLTEFSAARAMKHLEVLSRSPRPMGSLEHAQAREYIIRTLEEAGLKPEVQQTTVSAPAGAGSSSVGVVSNVVARLRGVEGGKAVLLSGHYDTVPNSPGASDNGAGVVTLLETLRALKAGAPLKHDVIFLFTDGEEVGLLGAKAFVTEHPSAKDVGLALNFDARGNSGVPIMFETSERNGRLIDEFAEAAPRPVANSLAFEVYRLMPNSTDMTVFKGAGLDGLNFGYIDGVSRYHTSLDTFQDFDPRSLQHQGSYALALARRFGDAKLESLKETNSVYFDVLGLFLVRYSNSLVLPLTLASVLLFAGVVALGFRRRELTVVGTAAGVGAFILSASGVFGVVTLAWWVTTKSLSEENSQWPTYRSDSYLLGFVAMSIGVTLIVYAFFRKKVAVKNLAVGALICWLCLTALTGLYLPGASYLFMWPLLFSLLGLAYSFVSKGGDGSVKKLAVLTACALPGIILLAPMISLVYTALGVGMAAAVMMLVVLLLGLLVQHFDLMAARRRLLLPVALLIVGAGVVASSGLTAKFDRSRPTQDNVFYGLESGTGKAVWASMDDKLDAWTAKFFARGAERKTLTDFFPLSNRKFLQAEAPAVALAAPNIQLLESAQSNDARDLHVHVSSPRQAPVIYLQLDSDAEVLSATVDGKPVKLQDSRGQQKKALRWGMHYYAPLPDGFDLKLTVKSSSPLKIKAIDQSYGLPETSAAPARPDYAIPAPIDFSDATFVSKTFTF